MIEKPKRPKKIQNQDNKQPQTMQELIRRYDLDNTKIYDFLDELIDDLKLEHTNIETKIKEETLENYSTDEQVVGTWIDGKTIYRKVVNFTMADSLNHWNNAVYMPCDTMISIKGYTIVNNGEWYPLPNAGGNEDIWFYFSRIDGWIREKHNYEYVSNQSCCLIIEYTK